MKKHRIVLLTTGSALLLAMEREMLIDQPYFVWALAEKTAAIRFYLHHGFREEYRIDGHVRLIKGDSRSG